ncbi:unnamed protein product [Leptidea sinapis]|uniref:Uncharacterized protein n=1 Tax=Leptidea sinapis TaxID=189913 RepID=A0A5E4PZ57_9NEOP|nr:unnamed protein product [Leptidea sinapis]
MIDSFGTNTPNNVYPNSVWRNYYDEFEYERGYFTPEAGFSTAIKSTIKSNSTRSWTIVREISVLDDGEIYEPLQHRANSDSVGLNSSKSESDGHLPSQPSSPELSLSSLIRGRSSSRAARGQHSGRAIGNRVRLFLEDDYVCEACRDLAMATVNHNLPSDVSGGVEAGTSTRGHTNVCLLCGCSILQRQSDIVLRETTEMQQYIYNIIESRVAPRDISSVDRICHASWMRTKREVIRMNRQDENRPLRNLTNVDVQQDETQTNEAAPAEPTQLEPSNYHEPPNCTEVLGTAALLLKMRTGNSDERIATLLQVPRRTLEGLMDKSIPHMMQNFEIAAALLNRFGVQDNINARQILEIVRGKINLDNNLANMVEAHNMNRRTANFQNITAHRNNVYFPMLEYNDLILFALGTYQIRQARSYYGEHVHFHGGYRIEVCSERLDSSGDNLRGSGDTILIRGKIKSHHISRRQQAGIVEYCCSCLVGRRTVG